MTREDADHVILQLERTFKKSFTKAGIVKIYGDLLREPEKAMEVAFDHFALSTAYLPSPVQLLAKVQAEGKRIRREQTVAAERAEKAKEVASDGNAIQRAARDLHAKTALIGFELLKTPGKGPADQLAFFRAMENQYPGIGWGTAGVEQQKWYEKRGLL